MLPLYYQSEQVAPFNRDSGQFRGKRHIYGGRASVRTLLYLGTLVAIRHNPPIRAYKVSSFLEISLGSDDLRLG